MTLARLSAKSRFASLYLQTLRSGTGLMVALFMLLFLTGPLPFILQSLQMLAVKRNAGGSGGGFGVGTYSMGNFTLYWFVALIGALVVGLITTSFMHNRQAMDVYGALPVKRASLLVGKALGGLTMLLVPFVLSGSIFFIGQGFLQAYQDTRPAWLYDLGAIFIYTAAVFCITVFCAVNTGTVFDTAMFTLAMCGAPSIALLLNRTFLQFSLTGYAASGDVQVILNLSPIGTPAARLLGGSASIGTLDYTLTSFLWWPIAAGLIMAAALYLFRRRNTERAGNSRTGGVMQMAVKLIFSYIAGILVSMLFSATIENNWICASLGFLLGAFVVYFIAEAILARGFKTFRRMLLQFAFVAAAILLFTGAVYTGGLGFSSRVPKAQDVASVTIGYTGTSSDQNYKLSYLLQQTDQASESRFTEPEIIAEALKIHTKIVGADSFGQIRKGRHEDLIMNSTRISYTLKNGRTITRDFSQTPIQARDELYVLDSLPAFRLKSNLISYLAPKNITGITRSDMTLASPQTLSLTPEQASTLLEAMKADIIAMPESETLTSSARELFTLTVNTRYESNAGGTISTTSWAKDTGLPATIPEEWNVIEDSFSLRVYAYQSNLLAVLRDLGWDISNTADLSGVGGAYLLEGPVVSSNWALGTAYANERWGGVYRTNDYPVSMTELYFFNTKFNPDMYSGDFKAIDGQWSDEMDYYFSSNRITDLARLEALERVSVPYYNRKEGERFYTVAFENAANGLADLSLDSAHMVSVYIIPESKAPAFLKDIAPIYQSVEK